MKKTIASCISLVVGFELAALAIATVMWITERGWEYSTYWDFAKGGNIVMALIVVAALCALAVFVIPVLIYHAIAGDK